jgi:hypothetical protein
MSSCTILRTFDVQHGTLNMVTGEHVISRTETVTAPCNVPLFGAAAARGICAACRRGWDVPGNTFANDAERTRAVQS